MPLSSSVWSLLECLNLLSWNVERDNEIWRVRDLEEFGASAACRKIACASSRAPKAQLLTMLPFCSSLAGWGTCESCVDDCLPRVLGRTLKRNSYMLWVPSEAKGSWIGFQEFLEPTQALNPSVFSELCSPPCPCRSEVGEGCWPQVPLFCFPIWSPDPVYCDLTFHVLYLLISSAFTESLWRWGRCLDCLSL